MSGDLGEGATVTGGEVAHVEIAFHHFGLAEETGLKNLLFFKFLTGSNGIIYSVEFVGSGIGPARLLSARVLLSDRC